MREIIQGASTWEQRFYDLLRSHIAGEISILKSYEELALTTTSAAFQYLAGVILDDERRHHQILTDLAETILTTSRMSGVPRPIPDLDFRLDRARILELTRTFLKSEQDDSRELARLSKELRDVRDTTLWELMLELVKADNEKHKRILRFIQARTKESPA